MALYRLWYAMPGNWQAGASQPSRATGTIFLYTYVCFYPARPHTVRLNVFLNLRTAVHPIP